MKKSVKKKWVAALRSGKYKQGTGTLRTQEDEFCCLGVLCEVARIEGVIPNPIRHYSRFQDETSWYYGKGSVNDGRRNGTLPWAVMKWAGIEDPNPHLSLNVTAAGWNDDKGADFNKIADLIEEYL